VCRTELGRDTKASPRQHIPGMPVRSQDLHSCAAGLLFEFWAKCAVICTCLQAALILCTTKYPVKCRRGTPIQRHLHQHLEQDLRPHRAQASAASQPARDDPAPAWLKKIIGESEYSTKFRLRRWLLFSGLVLGYSFYYLCRNSLNYVLPVMVNDKALGLSITQLAAMTSIFPIAYGAC
jgi:hypothetical protein